MPSLATLFLALAIELQIGSVFACAPNAPDCAIDKKQWIDLMTASLTGAFCKEDSPFLRCYEMDQTQCIKLTLKVTKQCIADNDNNIPQTFRKSDSREWGGIIGGCAGDKLTNIVHLKKGKSPNCGTQQP